MRDISTESRNLARFKKCEISPILDTDSFHKTKDARSQNVNLVQIFGKVSRISGIINPNSD